jgi:hypothetical protein
MIRNFPEPKTIYDLLADLSKRVYDLEEKLSKK